MNNGLTRLHAPLNHKPRMSKVENTCCTFPSSTPREPGAVHLFLLLTVHRRSHHSLGYGYNWGDLIIQYISQLTEPFTYKVLFVFESHTAQYMKVWAWLCDSNRSCCFTNDTSGRLKNGLNLVAYCLSWQPRNYTTIRHHPTTQHQIVYNTPHERLCEFTEAPWRWLLLGPLHALLSLGTARSRATHLHHIRPDGRSKKTWIS